MAWLRQLGGRLKSDYRYSIGIVYNTFPLPPGFLSGEQTAKLEPLAETVLDARAAWPDATLADLYDPDLMPPNLRGAHHRLDRAVDRLRGGFSSERERVEHLFTLYEQMQVPLATPTKGRRRRRRYKRGGFSSERERVEHLFTLYEQMQVPLATPTKGRRRRRR